MPIQHAIWKVGAKPEVLTVPLAPPPLAAQRRIVTKVDQLMALVDRLETKLVAFRATAKNRLDAIVAELTTND